MEKNNNNSIVEKLTKKLGFSINEFSDSMYLTAKLIAVNLLDSNDIKFKVISLLEGDDLSLYYANCQKNDKFIVMIFEVSSDTKPNFDIAILINDNDNLDIHSISLINQIDDVYKYNIDYRKFV